MSDRTPIILLIGVVLVAFGSVGVAAYKEDQTRTRQDRARSLCAIHHGYYADERCLAVDSVIHLPGEGK